MALLRPAASLSNLSDIYQYFSKNRTPIRYLGPSPYHLSGLEQWVAEFYAISTLPAVFPQPPSQLTVPPDANQEGGNNSNAINSLLKNSTFRHMLAEGEPGQLLLFHSDEETYHLAEELGQKLLQPSYRIRQKLTSPAVQSRLQLSAGGKAYPSTTGRFTSYDDYIAHIKSARLGPLVLAETAHGHNLVITSQHQWQEHAVKLHNQPLKLSRYRAFKTAAIEAICTKVGAFTTPLQLLIAGNQQALKAQDTSANHVGSQICGLHFAKASKAASQMAKRVGASLYELGHRGLFCLHLKLDSTTQDVAFDHVSFGISKTTALAHQTSMRYGGLPHILLHLLEQRKIKWHLPSTALDTRWHESPELSQILLHSSAENMQLVTRAPATGVYRWDKEFEPQHIAGLSGTTIPAGPHYAYYQTLRGVGDYTQPGTELGILVMNGPMLDESLAVSEQTREWLEAFASKYETISVSGSYLSGTSLNGVGSAL